MKFKKHARLQALMIENAAPQRNQEANVENKHYTELSDKPVYFNRKYFGKVELI
jgi:hypothetical protein